MTTPPQKPIAPRRAVRKPRPIKATPLWVLVASDGSLLSVQHSTYCGYYLTDKEQVTLFSSESAAEIRRHTDKASSIKGPVRVAQVSLVEVSSS